MDGIKYTPEEIEKAVASLGNQIEELKELRKEINAQIRKKRANLKFYLELDEKQLKAF